MLRVGRGRKIGGYPRATIGSLPIQAEYQALLDFATANAISLPSIVQQINGNRLMYDLKSTGAYAESDILYVPFGCGNSAFATLNWKNPAAYRLTLVNAITWSNTLGFVGDGVSAHLTTGWNASTNGVNYTLNDAGFMFYITQAAGASNTPLTGLSTTRNRISNSVADPQRLNSDTNSTVSSVMGGTGFRTANRNSAAQLTFTDGTVDLRALNSTAVHNDAQFFLRSSTVYGNAGVGLMSAGGSYAPIASITKSAVDAYQARI